MISYSYRNYTGRRVWVGHYYYDKQTQQNRTITQIEPSLPICIVKQP